MTVFTVVAVRNVHKGAPVLFRLVVTPRVTGTGIRPAQKSVIFHLRLHPALGPGLNGNLCCQPENVLSNICVLVVLDVAGVG